MRPHATPTASVLVICALASMSTLATNIFLPSLTSMAADLRASSAAVTSTISLFLAISAVGQLVVGPVSDRIGRRIPVLAGLCIFVIGTAWCAVAGDLANLLAGRSLQACGVCAATVLSRAIASDLLEGPAFARAMGSITVATAAAPGLSPLFGSALDHLFGWRSEFAFVGLFAGGLLAAYATLIGETQRAACAPLRAVEVARAYAGLLRNARFVAPARTAGLMMAALFALFSAAPRILLEHFGFSPTLLGLLFAGFVALVLAAATLAPGLSARLGLYRAMVIGLGIAAAGAGALVLAVLAAPHAILPFLLAAAIFLGGLGVASPLSSVGALSPFPAQAGAAAALFGFVQMAGAACGAGLAAVVSRDAALGLATVFGLAVPLALVLYARDGRRTDAEADPSASVTAPPARRALP